MKRNKYNAKKTAIIFKGELVKFDSQAESLRAVELQRLEMAGEISGLKLQPKFELQGKVDTGISKHRAINYIADFSYFERSSKEYVVEDVKGLLTPVFKLKMKMFLAKYGETGLMLRISKRKGNSFTLTDY